MVDILTSVSADGVEDCISLDAILAYITSNQKEGSDYIPGKRTELFTPWPLILWQQLEP